MIRFLFFFIVLSSGLFAEVPEFIGELEKDIAGQEQYIATLKSERDANKAIREKAENLAFDLEERLSNLRELTSGGDADEVTGALLQKAYLDIKSLRKGNLPYSIDDVQADLQVHRATLFQVKDLKEAPSLDLPEDIQSDSALKMN